MNKALSYRSYFYSTQATYISNRTGAVKMFLLIESKTNPEKTKAVNIPDNMSNSENPQQLARDEIEKINNQPERT